MRVTPIEVSVLLHGWPPPEVEVASPGFAFPSPIESILGAVPAMIVAVIRIVRLVTGAGREAEGSRHHCGDHEKPGKSMLVPHVSNPMKMLHAMRGNSRARWSTAESIQK
jgi:hypothetical protein